MYINNDIYIMCKKHSYQYINIFVHTNKLEILRSNFWQIKETHSHKKRTTHFS